MKKFFILISALTIIATAWSQVPEKMSYQAVIRNTGNELVINQEVGMKISILQGSANGASVYIETRTPTTNANGLVSIELGGQDATVVSGSFSAIDWADGPYFLKTETDPSGGTNYSITGTCQLLSVPYAMHSRSSEILTGEITEDQISDLKDYLTNETDPLFSEWDKSAGITITENQVTDLKEYLTEETDPVFDSSPAAGIEATHITSWNAAHGWGDHSTQGYLKSLNEADPTWSGDANQSGNIGREGNVGIGTASPTQKLDVNGQVRIRGGSPAAGKVLTSDAIGVAAWETLGNLPPGGTAGGDLAGTYPNPNVAGIRGRNISTAAPTTGQVLKWDGSSWSPGSDLSGSSLWMEAGSNIYYNSGRVGVGTSSPATLLHLHGAPVTSRGQLSLSAPSGQGSFLSFYEADEFKAYLWYDVSDDNLRLQNYTAGNLNLNPYGGRVGIGTNTPSTTLHVNGQIRITGGSPAAGRVLTSDATGLATWQATTGARTYVVGDFAHGGIVFWVDETGHHGLVCAKEDQSTNVMWYAGTYGVTQAKGDGPYAGRANTPIIIAAQVAIGDNGTTNAARICNELQVTEGGKTYGDWYLPSSEEMNLMYQNKSAINSTARANGGSDFANAYYWSSTEVNLSYVKIWHFNYGGPMNGDKGDTCRLRAVRAF